jgi:hypothetical protein
MAVASLAGMIWQVRLVGEIHGQKTVNVLHFRAPGAVDDITVRLILVLVNCFITHLKPVLSADFTLKEVRYQFMTTDPPGIEHIDPVVGGTGAGSGTSLPSFCSAVIDIRSAIGGGSGRGRMSLAGIAEDQSIDSGLDPAGPLYAGLVNFVACVATAFIHLGTPPANALQWVVYSRKLGGAKVPYTIAGASDVVNASVKTQIGTINSRKIGRGA